MGKSDARPSGGGKRLGAPCFVKKIFVDNMANISQN